MKLTYKITPGFLTIYADDVTPQDRIPTLESMLLGLFDPLIKAGPLCWIGRDELKGSIRVSDRVDSLLGIRADKGRVIEHAWEQDLQGSGSLFSNGKMVFNWVYSDPDAVSSCAPQNTKVWDRLFDLLYVCDETVTDAEVDADLRQAGIDMRPAFRRMQEMIEQRQARQRLARANPDSVHWEPAALVEAKQNIANVWTRLNQLIGSNPSPDLDTAVGRVEKDYVRLTQERAAFQREIMQAITQFAGTGAVRDYMENRLSLADAIKSLLDKFAQLNTLHTELLQEHQVLIKERDEAVNAARKVRAVPGVPESQSFTGYIQAARDLAVRNSQLEIADQLKGVMNRNWQKVTNTFGESSWEPNDLVAVNQVIGDVQQMIERFSGMKFDGLALAMEWLKRDYKAHEEFKISSQKLAENHIRLKDQFAPVLDWLNKINGSKFLTLVDVLTYMEKHGLAHHSLQVNPMSQKPTEAECPVWSVDDMDHWSKWIMGDIVYPTSTWNSPERKGWISVSSLVFPPSPPTTVDTVENRKFPLTIGHWYYFQVLKRWCIDKLVSLDAVAKTALFTESKDIPWEGIYYHPPTERT